MVVVVETNVFVSALLGPAGASRETLRYCLRGRLRPLMGASLFAEYESVLSRRELFETCALSDRERDEVLNGFLSVCRWTRVYYLWRPNLPDQADNHLIELAVAGGADAVITKNVRDLARSELHFPGLRILRPEQIVEEVG